ncbi:OmpA family protein [Paenimyroides tangerinum]|uniref:OmpA family protein n=1 Tax=Paenimyroides tangerinum TaxID=2488728 RepID=A0A3P3WI49_9FLAO|nr:OmpA family protein [Paenimyroides tangerinum]RRJ92433.1 OmpA family protein [Paenimyroides tangerinum]
MMKKIALLVFGFCVMTSNAQQLQELKANRNYQDYAYIDAISIYTKLANKGYKSENILRKLGNAHYFSANYPEAAKWYNELFEMTTNVEPEIYFRYSNALKSIGQIEKANQYLDKFIQLSENDSRAVKFKNNPNYLKEIEKQKDKYLVGYANVNSKYSDYAVTFWNDKLILSSNRPGSSKASKINTWDGQPFASLFVLNGKKMESFDALDSKYNISTPTFTKDGNTVYFTQNNLIKNKNNHGFTSNLKIFRADYVDEKWKNITELPFNNDDYSCAHPILSQDEKALYFSSDMPGTYGDSDIYRVKIFGNNQYSLPENLGKKINTEGKETFPFMGSDNVLYFASNGHLGLGGLDIYKIDLKDENAEVVNLGEPVNSSFDDFAIYLKTDNKTGFFASNRPKGLGYDDIYSINDIVRTPKPVPYLHSFSGNVMDRLTEVPINKVKVSVLDANFHPLYDVFSVANGTFQLPKIAGSPGDVVYVKAEHPDYITEEKRMILPEKAGDTKVIIKMDKRIVEVGKGDDLAKVFEIENVIYFDYDKSNIRMDAAVELAKVYEVLAEYPKMKIDVRSHTDSRGSDKYNQKLSEQRAQGTIKWLIEQGVDPSRLSGKGYGESMLVNDCEDGVKCSEEEHQKNRRSEFIITDL